MDRLVEGFACFRKDVYPRQSALYQTLVRDGQKPEALVVSCSDSRVMPEVFTQSDPGDMFVTRNAGNIVPPYGHEAAGAVTSAIEYAVKGLGRAPHHRLWPHRLRRDESAARSRRPKGHARRRRLARPLLLRA